MIIHKEVNSGSIEGYASLHLLGIHTISVNLFVLNTITHSGRTIDISILDLSQLKGPKNYTIWSLFIKHMLECHRL